MSDSITIRIPDNLKKELDAIIKNDNISKSDFIREALKRYLSIKKFRQLRKKILPFAEASGFLNDSDIFKVLK